MINKITDYKIFHDRLLFYNFRFLKNFVSDNISSAKRSIIKVLTMPYLRLETNVQQEKIPKDLPQKLCGVLAKSLGKPVNYCVATVVGGVNMSFGGTNEPAAQATLMSIGALGVDQNKKHSKAIFDVICKEIGISPDKMYISFTNAPSSDVGFNGTTFHDILGG